MTHGIGRTALVGFLALVAFAATVAPPAAAPPTWAGEPAAKPPEAKAGGDVFEWTSAGGVVCRWRGPLRYDAARGASLTFVLHGSNLDRRWGFANHDPKTFRPDDFVVSPDGTTSNGKGGFNFLEGDTKKFHGLVEELRKALKPRAVYVYGHSQGSFFGLHHAGAFPDDVDGVVAHASGLWAASQRGPRGHRHAIVLMHGTQDPVVPYTNSLGAFEALRDAGYPNVRLRSLEGWNHWPAELNGPVPHTSQQLAWVEGMTTTDADRLRVCLTALLDVDAGAAAELDFGGIASLARRIEGLESAPADLRARAAKARAAVESSATAHVAAMALPAKLALERKPWVGHLPVFLRAFPGVPARDELADRLEATIAQHRKDAVAQLRKHYAALGKQKPDEAFEAGVAAVAAGFTWCECWSNDFRETLRAAHKDAKKLKLGKAALKAYDEAFVPFDASIADGWKEYESVCRKFRAD